MVMATCAYCDLDYVVEDDIQPHDVCDDCVAELQRIHSMTPAERRTDELAMARYGDDNEGI
jgi:uncharacterized Zn ribbon protein